MMTEPAMIQEWRCTRNQPYDCKTCSGFKDISTRQGHYIRVDTWDEAINAMRKRFPDDTDGFTATRGSMKLKITATPALTETELRYNRRFECPQCHSRRVRINTIKRQYGHVLPDGSLTYLDGCDDFFINDGGDCLCCGYEWDEDESLPIVKEEVDDEKDH